ncbi:MAG: hypothetical protein PHY34_06140 [Patescibacteria group bacterium]|nr:hypothetical protein [Patescibacteria group bacterium]MDD5715776.1 hypothetical protein [Patescibacteria group bacterium]
MLEAEKQLEEVKFLYKVCGVKGDEGDSILFNCIGAFLNGCW